MVHVGVSGPTLFTLQTYSGPGCCQVISALVVFQPLDDQHHIQLHKCQCVKCSSETIITVLLFTNCEKKQLAYL